MTTYFYEVNYNDKQIFKGQANIKGITPSVIISQCWNHYRRTLPKSTPGYGVANKVSVKDFIEHAQKFGLTLQLTS